jgi:putative SOS response-associated peptidase YedK
MCGRIALYSDPDRIARILDAQLALDREGWGPSWNVGPTDPILGVSEDDHGIRSLSAYRWGLLRVGAKDPKQGARSFNARSETVATKPTFRSAFKRGRILVPADGFFEWRTAGKVKTPSFFTRSDGDPIVLAGLRERWRSPAGEVIRSATILTTESGPDMDGIHDRMPVVLEREAWEHWLDPAAANRDELEPLLVPARAGTLIHHQVDRAVGNVRNNGPELIGAVDDRQPPLWTSP